MLFNSIEFAIFLPVVFILYWFACRKTIRLQNALLVVASYFFYGWWDWRFLILILASSLLDFLVGLGLDRAQNSRRRKWLLAASLGLNLGLLGLFKYYNFFADSLADAFTLFGRPLDPARLNIVLPVGISFYTFQTLSYSIDVYRRNMEPSRNLLAFLAYVSFFPQLVAGPIERASNLLPQFLVPRQFDCDRAIDGLRQCLWGLFKKMVVADTCAHYANDIFGHSDAYSGSTLFLGALFFAFQIYGDFSGYSDIAIGTARLFGFRLMRNFNYPYFSRDIAEFWRRWHISLSTWFRDYVYIPLGGSRGSRGQNLRNTFIIFLASGFWHGANWTFVVWGLWHGMFLVLERMGIGAALERAWRPVRHLYVMAVVMAGWVFFRAATLPEAWRILRALVGAGAESGSGYSAHLYLTPLWILTAAAGCVAATPIPAALAQRALRAAPSARIRFSLRLAATAGLLALLTYSAISVACSAYNPFIYFRF
jgi:D-alanyl-lipoteichoic acid acyltransferase DltB (MBOAT superfamily)